MNELIKIGESGKGTLVVNARDLHAYLGVGQDFSNWLKARLRKYGFQEGVDYARIFYDIDGKKISLAKNGESNESQFEHVFRIEYALTLDCAKEIAMVQNNDKGRELRKYFIEVEKKYKAKELLALQPAIIPAKLYSISEVADRLNLSDYYGKIGRNALYNILYHNKITDEKNRSFPKYVKKGYFVNSPIGTKATEGGLNWLNQIFTVEKTSNSENSDLNKLIENQQDEIKELKEGMTCVIETLLYNKGGNHTEEKNREVVARMQRYLEISSGNAPKALGM
jgi:phage anti-repressor protein